jgi:hypothetical protein
MALSLDEWDSDTRKTFCSRLLSNLSFLEIPSVCQRSVLSPLWTSAVAGLRGCGVAGEQGRHCSRETMQVGSRFPDILTFDILHLLRSGLVRGKETEG